MSNLPSKAKLILGSACALVTFGVVGGAWYAFPILKRHDVMLAQNAGMKRSVDALGNRIDQQNSKIAEWSKTQDNVQAEIDTLRKEMQSRIASARKVAGKSAEELIRRVQTEISSEIDGIKEKVAGLETSRAADRAQIAALETELGQLRNDMAAQTQQLRDQIAENGAGTGKQLTSLVESQTRDREALESLNKRLATRRIDFEVAKGHSYELSPGISLEISSTDVAYRRVTGWMWVLPDRRTIWLRDHGAQEPIVFYENSDGKKRELVITSVTKTSAIGYLMLPEDSVKSASAAAAEVNASE